MDRVQKDANGKPICLPYYYLKSAIYERRLTLYRKCDLLTDELVGLERKADGHVDHTKQGIDSKDQADALCGALWDASKFSEEYSYSYGDHLSAAFEANSVSTINEEKKKKFIEDFQNELLGLQKELDESFDLDVQKQNEEIHYYQNLLDGIIAI